MGSGGIRCARCGHVLTAVLVATMTNGVAKPHPAREFHARFVAFCTDCVRAGIRAPSPEEWIEILVAGDGYAGDEPSTP